MKRKNIAVSEEVYQELLSYRAEVQKQNSKSLSFSDAIELLLTELAGDEYAAASDRLEASGYRYQA